MNFDLSEDERLVQQTARDFADRVLRPRAAEFDRTGSIPREVLSQMAELGFMGMLIPEEHGGSGLDNFCLALVQMEVNRACASTGVTMSVHNSLFASPLIRFATGAQKKAILPKAARAEWIGAYSLSEPGSGSDAGALRATAVRKGGHWVLNGTKNFVTNGGIADIFIVFARTHPDPALKTKGISAILVERTAKGLVVGKHESKLGIRGSTTTELAFQDCQVPLENLVGGENEGFKVAMVTLDGGRIGIAAQAVGIAQACLDASIKYAKERRQFGKPIGEFQAIQWKLANMATDIDAARYLVLRAARLRDEGKPHVVEASMAKLFAADMVNRHASEAVQIHGGVGYVKEFSVERYFRDAKITEIYEGTSEIQRMVIARTLLK
ncbi:MAG TPA: acyl-CoA dehydrogenase [Planctomycetota bacterium]|nr:acyl-CoA dehydrogenase [Planctomycetota bacterium]